VKTRADSWYANLTEEQLWQLYSVSRRSQWFETVKFAQENFALEAKVSRSAYYRWLDFMRGEESERRLAQARLAAVEAAKLAEGVGLSDDKAILADKSLAAECALKSDAKTANNFMRLATDLIDRQLKAKELNFKAKDLERKDEELKLAQEKFAAAEKRLAAMAEVADAARGGKVDPAKVADEIDRILGRKK
jgi:hypothetical protein